MKKIILFGLILVIIGVVVSYTPPNNQHVNLVLDRSYTSPNNQHVNLVLSDVGNDCIPPSLNNNWIINDGSICVLDSNVNLGSGKLYIYDGKIYVPDGYSLVSSGCWISQSSDGLFIEDNGSIYCG